MLLSDGLRPNHHSSALRCWSGARLFLGLVAVCFAPSLVAAQEQESLAMQMPEAQSVGTSTNLKAASETLLSKFDELSKHKEQLTAKALFEALRPHPAGQRDLTERAIRFFLASPIARRLAGEKGRKGMTREGLERASKAAADPKLDELLQSLRDPQDRTSKSFEAELLRDPGVPDVVRRQLLTRITDQQLLEIVGRPNFLGDARDKHDELAEFVFLARLSWLGAAEAEAIAKYKVAYVVTRGDDDKHASYWDHHRVKLSEFMLTGRKGGTVDAEALRTRIGLFAHESGHALYDLSGVQKRFEADLARHGLTRAPGTKGIGGIVNENIAGVFQNRAGIAAEGFGTSKSRDKYLSIDKALLKNIANDQTMYAKYYHIDTSQARAKLPLIRRMIAIHVIPWFENQFGLIGDPQLTMGLPLRAARN